MGTRPADGIRIAVLPFEDTSPRSDQGHLAGGISEDILDKLDGVEGLRVAARASSWAFRGSQPGDPNLRGKLGVHVVLTGEIKRDGDSIQINAVMSKSADGSSIWSETYDRPASELFSAIEDIVRSIATRLKLEAGEIRPPITTNVDAFDHFLKGLTYSREFSRISVHLGLDMFQIATEMDPEFALAFAGVSDASAQLFLGGERTDLNKRTALEASTRAVELMPDHPRPHISRGIALIIDGQSEAGLAELEEAMRLDPESFDAHYAYGRESFSKGNMDKAKEMFERAAAIRPDDYQTPTLMALIFESQGRKMEADAMRRRGLELANQQMKRHPDDVRALYMGANALVALGDTSDGLEWAKRAKNVAPEEPMLLYNLGCIYALADELDEAMGLLESAVEFGYADHGWMAADDDLAPLRGSERFEALQAKMKEAG